MKNKHLYIVVGTVTAMKHRNNIQSVRRKLCLLFTPSEMTKIPEMLKHWIELIFFHYFIEPEFGLSNSFAVITESITLRQIELTSSLSPQTFSKHRC